MARRAATVGRTLLLAVVAGVVVPADRAGAADGDERVAWLRSHAVALSTIDPRSDDFADLERLRPAPTRCWHT